MLNKKLCIAGLLLLSTTGCTGMNNTEQGALSGGALGGLFGLLVGGRHPLAAAAVGATGGALVGGAIGNSEDRRDDRRTAQAIAVANAQAQRQMPLTEIVQMAQQKVPDQIIINQMSTSGSRFDLRGDDILYLRQNGVSDRVISEMQVRSGPRTVIVQPYGAPPPYVSGGYVYTR